MITLPTTLPKDSAERKEYPLSEGCLAYFPAALAGVARTSKISNEKHNPGMPMHWSRDKSSDHADCIVRHLMDVNDLLAEVLRGRPDNRRAYTDALLHEVNQLAWRALAFSQELHEAHAPRLVPHSPASRFPERPEDDIGDYS